MEFTVARTRNTSGAHTVTYIIRGDNITDGDYTDSLSGNLSFTDGQTSGKIYLQIEENSDVGDETLEVRLTGILPVQDPNTVLDQSNKVATGVIRDAAALGGASSIGYTYDTLGRLTDTVYDGGEIVSFDYDAAGNRKTVSASTDGVSFSVEGPSAGVGPAVPEGQDLVFIIRRTGAPSQDYNVSFETSPVANANTGDYTYVSETRTFTVGGPDVEEVRVATTPDTVWEYDQQIDLRITNVSPGAIIAKASERGTILNDDPGPEFSIQSAASGTEGQDLIFNIRKSGATEGIHSVRYSTVPGTANAADYASVTNQSVPFAAGVDELSIRVRATPDDDVEGSQYFYVDLVSATNDATIDNAQSRATGTILDGTAAEPVRFSVTSNGNRREDWGQAFFTVSYTGTLTQTVFVDYETRDNSATSVGAEDYNAKSDRLRFDPGGPSSQVVSVILEDDNVWENNESFDLYLTGVSTGGEIATASARVGIIDNDNGPVFSISDAPSVIEGYNLVFKITMTGETRGTHRISYTTEDGTGPFPATASQDYITKSQTDLSFTSSARERFITIETIDDQLGESEESLRVRLFDPKPTGPQPTRISPTNGVAIGRIIDGGQTCDDVEC